MREVTTSGANTAAHGPAVSTRADGAVADYSRGVGAQVVVVPTDAKRGDPDLAGHRATELTPASRTSTENVSAPAFTALTAGRGNEPGSATPRLGPPLHVAAV